MVSTEDLRELHELVDQFLKLKGRIDNAAAILLKDVDFQANASTIIPEDLRNSPTGYAFLKKVVGENADKLYIKSPDLKDMVPSGL